MEGTADIITKEETVLTNISEESKTDERSPRLLNRILSLQNRQQLFL